MFDEMITLKKLEIFLTFMKVGTLSEAANQLQLSSVSVHRAIHSLEEGLKCPLFRQEGRLLTPLPSARVLEERVTQVLNDLQDGITSTREVAGIYSNQFKLGALYSLTINTLPQLIAGLKRRKSDLNIELSLGSNSSLLSKLRNFELDVIIVSSEKTLEDDEFTSLPLFEDELMLAVSRDSSLAKQRSIKLETFQNENFVTLSSGFATAEDTKKVFQRASIQPNVVMEVGDIFSLMSMVSGNVGYAILPRRVEHVFDNKIKLLSIENMPDMKQHVVMVCLASRERDPRILNCIVECRHYARNHKR
ncbi:HTH-type transcriptional regulator CynR [Marinomonas spartinae]|uniref:HTH-type transcriptional regulator CynR n=1 Tax=Marinomonas spartinae TaxID=1792290 RepID=A0A1A8TKN1_9GAMM|nr:LysR family transcriptional regulator [Marinomonas spartinae]SBS33255.1 HTH-type transcriptional regulator CynR [Marinomonas spartinae]SBS34761.1 HTH-type transcriptional regulator CynR [Marinomonas spartinae]